MSAGALQRLDEAARRMAPAATTLLLVPLSVVPLHLPFYATVPPLFILMPLFYWGVHRPDLLPLSVVFLVGLLTDVLTGAPLGINAFVLVACYGLIVNQGRFLLGEPFAVVWFGFALFAGLAALLLWLAFSLHTAAAMPVRPVLFQTLLTVALFPIPAWLCVRLHRFLPAAA